MKRTKIYKPSLERVQPSSHKKTVKNKTDHRIQLKTATIIKELYGEVIRITFPWNPENLSQIKGIRGRQWDKVKKQWIIPLTLDNCYKLKELKYKFSESLKEWGNNAFDNNEQKTIEIPGLQGSLLPYQHGGVLFLERFKGRGLIADEMGLGKTVQALAWMQLHKEKVPMVIICPASLKINWYRESMKWMENPNVRILNGTKIDTDIVADILIINFDIVPYWVNFLKSLKPQVIVIDEVHYIKSSSAKRTKATKKLCKGVPHLIQLSGTPIENAPIEIYNSVHMINPTLFPNAWSFKHRYCGAKHNGFGWQFNGASNIKELHDILVKNVMIRRKKKDVLKDLPDKMYSFIPLEINNRKEYQKAEDDFKGYVRKKATDSFDSGTKETENKMKEQLQMFMEKYNIDDLDMGVSELSVNNEKEVYVEEAVEKANAMSRVEVLKQLAVRGKMKSVINWVEDFLESGEKLVLFCEHKFVIEELMEYFKKVAVKIDGSVSTKRRDEAVQLFQNNKKIRLFIGNKAAEVGLTLTAASNVAVMEYPWTPGALAQRIDRCHRIGQKYTVNVFYLMALNSIEEKIAKMLDEKQKVLDAVLDGKDSGQLNLLEQLMNEYK